MLRIITEFTEIHLSFMQKWKKMEKKRGSTDQYSCVWYLNYMQKEDKMPSKDVCLCIYVCIYIYAHTVQKYNILVSIVHLKIKAHLTAVT